MSPLASESRVIQLGKRLTEKTGTFPNTFYARLNA
jgi:hypothetical protein